MTTAHFLVDYYNVASIKRGLEATYNDHYDALAELVSSIEQYARLKLPSTSELRVRLYGGWLQSENAGRTADGGSLHALAAQHFRTRLSRKLRLLVELAEALVDLPSERLQHTLRSKPGLPWFRLTVAACPHAQSSCPLHELSSWRKGTCPRAPACAVQTTDIAEVVQQKLVDSMIVSDAHALSRDTGTPVIVVSNDDDVVPGVLSASRVNPSIRLFRLGRRKPSPYDALLQQYRVDFNDR